MAKILVCDDDREIVEAIDIYLTQEGYEVLKAYDGQEALGVLKANDVDLLVIDVMMPRLDGLSVLRKMRSGGNPVPVLLLTAKDAVSDRVQGLDAGADDYLTKPYAFEELMARIRALVRRNSTEKSDVLTVGDLSVELSTKRVMRGGKEILLSAKEFGLLETLIRHKGQVLSRAQLENQVWDFGFEGSSNIVDVYIRYLRRKVDDPFEKKLIHTIRGAGYVLKEE